MPVRLATVGTAPLAPRALRKPAVRLPSEVLGKVVVFTVPSAETTPGKVPLGPPLRLGWVPPEPTILPPPSSVLPRIQLNPRALLSVCVISANLALILI